MLSNNMLVYLYLQVKESTMNTHNKLALFMLVICAFLVGCTPVYYAPDSGTWYCEELQAQFIADDPDEAGTYVIVGGDKIVCAIDLQKNSKHFAILCQESDNNKYDLGEVIYALEVVSLSDSEYVLKDEEGKEYIFVRID